MRAYIKMSVAMAIVGSFIVANKVITGVFPVFLASELRLSIGAVTLIFLLYIKEKRFPCISRRDLFLFIFQTFVGVFMFSIFMLYGLKFTTGIESGIITSTTPAVVGLISFFFLKERLTWNHVIGILCAVLGTMAINVVGAFSNTAHGAHALFGNLLIFGAVVGEAIFFTFRKFVSKDLSALVISTVVSITGSLLFLPFAVYQAWKFDFSGVTVNDWLLILYCGVVVTALAVILMNQGIAVVPASSAAVFTAIMPISAVVLSCLFLHETFYWYHYVAIGCVLAGIVFIAKAPPVRTKALNRMAEQARTT
nr:DMT family transporter [Aneurinibacillus terranovensis]